MQSPALAILAAVVGCLILLGCQEQSQEYRGPVGDLASEPLAVEADPKEIVSCAILRGDRVSRAECDRVEEFNANLEPGSGAVDHPETIQRGETATVSFVVSDDPDSGSVADLLGSDAEKEVTLRIGRRMAAQLQGDGFKIEPLGIVERDLYAGPGARWEWKVTALKAPRHRLMLSAYVVVPAIGGTNKEMLLRTLELPLAVKVTWGQWFEDFFSDTGAWLTNGANWLKALAAFIAAALALWFTVFKKKQPSTP